MNKKVISVILLAILALGLGYSIYEFFFISFPLGILDPILWWVAAPLLIAIVAPIINFVVVYFSNKSRAKSKSLFLASIYSVGLFVVLKLTTFPVAGIQLRVWTPALIVGTTILIIASYFLTRKK